ncbi:hypothetical protein [Acidihalobacter prosperus]
MPEGQQTQASNQHGMLGVLRIGLGLIWCLNIWFHLHGAHLNHYVQQYQVALKNGPHWLAPWLNQVIAAFEAIGPHNAAIISVIIEALIALSLLTGWWGRAGSWLGLLYSLFMFSTVNTFAAPVGGPGYTDPGPWPPYIIDFILILETKAWQVCRLGNAQDTNVSIPRQAPVAILVYGALWAFDAFWKWHPSFIGNFLSFLTPAVKGQPNWIAAYIEFVIIVISAIWGTVFGVITAIVETLIALSLLTKRLLPYGLVLGVVWSLGIWTTAEGWGGPYGAGFSSTPMPGDILGNAINYAYIFLLLMAVYLPWKMNQRQGQV